LRNPKVWKDSNKEYQDSIGGSALGAAEEGGYEKAHGDGSDEEQEKPQKDDGRTAILEQRAATDEREQQRKYKVYRDKMQVPARLVGNSAGAQLEQYLLQLELLVEHKRFNHIRYGKHEDQHQSNCKQVADIAPEVFAFEADRGEVDCPILRKHQKRIWSAVRVLTRGGGGEHTFFSPAGQCPPAADLE
jgi:hypothetical protein